MRRGSCCRKAKCKFLLILITLLLMGPIIIVSVIAMVLAVLPVYIILVVSLARILYWWRSNRVKEIKVLNGRTDTKGNDIEQQHSDS